MSSSWWPSADSYHAEESQRSCYRRNSLDTTFQPCKCITSGRKTGPYYSAAVLSWIGTHSSQEHFYPSGTSPRSSPAMTGRSGQQRSRWMTGATCDQFPVLRLFCSCFVEPHTLSPSYLWAIKVIQDNIPASLHSCRCATVFTNISYSYNLSHWDFITSEVMCEDFLLFMYLLKLWQQIGYIRTDRLMDWL